MKIVNLQKLLDEALVGKKIAVQPNLDSVYFGATISGVWPTSYNEGCDNGYVICCENSLHLIISENQEIVVED